MPAFRKAGLVYLQGWGEPFTHPRFFEMLKLAKEAGCRVGTTTNGTLLNRRLIEKLVKEDLDVVGFSLAGVDEKNDSVRKGTRIKKVVECIEEIHRARAKYNSDSPKIHIAYMLLRSGLADLEKLPEFLSGKGVDQTVVSSLALVVNPGMETESLPATEEEKDYRELKHRLLHVRDEAAAVDADVHFHLVSALKKDFACSENVPGALVVGADGSISPCVMKQLPVQGENWYYFRGRRHRHRNLCFGNITSSSLDSIWHQKDYQQFIREFSNAKTPATCHNCSKRQSDCIA